MRAILDLASALAVAQVQKSLAPDAAARVIADTCARLVLDASALAAAGHRSGNRYGAPGPRVFIDHVTGHFKEKGLADTLSATR